MSYALGVDLGTTFTSAALARNGHVEAVQLSDHAAEVPSVVYLGPDGRYLVGDVAVAREVEQADRVAREFKRRIGDSTSLRLGGVPVPAHLLTAKLLASVLATATSRQGSPPERVTVTCPATWGPHKRETLQQALDIADVPHGVLTTEPEAAALHFGAADRLSEGQVIAVYDLGGGTFDATVLQRRDTGLHFLGRPEGLDNLGGLDFDAAVIAHVWRQLGLDDAGPRADHPDDDPLVRRGMVQLREECVRAKERLSYDVSASIPVTIPGAARLVRLTRTELEELISPLVEETVACLERALRRAEIRAEELAGVLLVGGSSRIPLISERLTERLGRPLPPSPQPKLCVAMGAALLPAPPRMPTQTSPASAPGEKTRASVPATPRPTAAAAQSGAEALRDGPAPAAPPVSRPAAHAASHAETPQAGHPAAPGEAAPGEAAKDEAPPPREARGNRRALAYAAVAAVLVCSGLLLAWLLPQEPGGRALTVDDSAVPAEEVPRDARTLELRVLGTTLPRVPIERASGDDAFALSSSQTLFMTGPVAVVLRDEDGAQVPPASSNLPQWLAPDHASWWQALVTIPGGGAVLALLFSVAYGESLLRAARSHPGRVAPSEVLGLAGVGAILGVAVTLLVWASGRALTGDVLGLTALLLASGLGLVPFALAARTPPAR